MMKIKYIFKSILIAELILSILPIAAFANDNTLMNDDSNIGIGVDSHLVVNDDSKKISLIIEKGNSVELIVTHFIKQFDYQIKWDTEDFISGYRVSYEGEDPMDVLKEFVNDVRKNGKLIKATVYKNNILVVENESK
ncbi:hypothetical protein [Shewanella sp. YLB-07]|uniref:hypothetical protein n=1 Tax=Shewanella sp. YLB-07 TaxID=2601268 RepID=UPI00128B714F|nr:hypothetical protein [Shewanella sp. YLB-07]MPY22333.1 hypothetical protein [Shewanella sp. YLB-07]